MATQGRLHYTSDAKPGFTRIRNGTSFRYRDASGRPLRDAATLSRIRSLAIPPAWTAVWIGPQPNGHLQATGRDARGRKQYRYHPRWRAEREGDKFDRLREFGRALPAIRAKVRQHLALPGLPREKVLAMIVRLLERTAIRVGNEKYARDNDSFGLTTFRNKHVKVSGERIEFDFKGKSGKVHRVAIDDLRLADLVRRCRDLPGYELFQYVEAQSGVRPVDSGDVNDYLRAISGVEVTAKDFRTWIASVGVARAVSASEQPEARATLTAAIEDAARLLGNTAAICRKSYVHPSVLRPTAWVHRIGKGRRPKRIRGLREGEQLLMDVLASDARSPTEWLQASLAEARRKKRGPKRAPNPTNRFRVDAGLRNRNIHAGTA